MDERRGPSDARQSTERERVWQYNIYITRLVAPNMQMLSDRHMSLDLTNRPLGQHSMAARRRMDEAPELWVNSTMALMNTDRDA